MFLGLCRALKSAKARLKSRPFGNFAEVPCMAISANQTSLELSNGSPYWTPRESSNFQEERHDGKSKTLENVEDKVDKTKTQAIFDCLIKSIGSSHFNEEGYPVIGDVVVKQLSDFVDKKDNEHSQVKIGTDQFMHQSQEQVKSQVKVEFNPIESYQQAQKKESSITPTLTKCHTIKEQMAKNTKKVQRIASDTVYEYYYDKDACLGSGGFGSVYKGYAISGSKQIPDPQLGRIPSEVYFLKQMQFHKNVIKFYHYQKVSSEQFVIIMERSLNSSDLLKLRAENGGKLSEDESKSIITKLVRVMKAMEKKNIMHRDLKMENIIYDKVTNDIKIIDFGLACFSPPGKIFFNFSGTLKNIPPEFYNEGEYQLRKEAVRSVGVIAYELICGKPVYNENLHRHECTAGLPDFDQVSDDLRDLLQKLFAMESENRPDIRMIIKHRWFRTSSKFQRFLRRGLKLLRGISPCGTSKL
ncbi:serine/threonine-protein kinase pim-2-like [Xenia sp. Carnegie-2017]|uniref:serine/threonine-protein kinase pim-2-like n=1 Tax=Xenia sp. Carnegie-2017 TaxID=2897299 RepID=UPI001F0457CA|nr:serine/threonine-protein kinase pim-2-like [Xenia sp. Carnegie-2017]